MSPDTIFLCEIKEKMNSGKIDMTEIAVMAGKLASLLDTKDVINTGNV